MFGYVIPYKPELKMQEFDLYRSVYCGLCKQLGKDHTFFARFFLSYDTTFLSLLSLALSKERKPIQRKICAAHPAHKKSCLESCKELSFASNTAMIMVYFSCKDHIEDHLFPLPYYSLLPFLYLTCKQARKKEPEVFMIFKQMVQSQKEQEKNKQPSIDLAADSTAQALSNLASLLAEEKSQKEILRHFGYMLGRYIYLMDALDDLQKDRKSGCYNPYLQKFPDQSNEEIQEKAQEMIHLTIAQLASAYELLDIQQYKPLLDNIIYQGLSHSLHRVLGKKKSRKEQKELLYEQSI